MEAQIFKHYLETQKLLTFEEAKQKLSEVASSARTANDLAAPQLEVSLNHEDYILGLFDATGELMRFAITTMATSDTQNSQNHAGESEQVPPPRSVLQDLQTLRTLLATLAAKSDFDWHMNKDTNGKLQVMFASVEKVEKALYGLTVRGSERPSGWMPDFSESRPQIEAEG